MHSGPEPERHGFNVKPSPHDLEDTYLPAFRATVVEGHADSVMCAYNAVDGVPACASKFLLQDTLRDAWKFQGYVTSDCGAVGDITDGPQITPRTMSTARPLAVQAGTDTTCGNEYVALVQAVQDGLIKESEIDTSLKRLFTARFRMGMFDPPQRGGLQPDSLLRRSTRPTHRQLALRAARESIVLLKNQDGILPLKSNIKTIAVVGPNAESLAALEGNYNGTPSHPVYPLDGNARKSSPARRRSSMPRARPTLEELPVPVPSSVFHLADDAASAGTERRNTSPTPTSPASPC